MNAPECSKYANRTKKAWYYPETNQKTCAKCLSTVDIVNFYKHKQTKDGYHSWCKQCCKDGNKRSKDKKYSSFEGRIQTFLRSCRVSAAKRNQKCTLSADDLKNAWRQQGGICAYTGWEMTTAAGAYNSVSIERIDSSVGYIPSNTIFVCFAVNKMKSDFPGHVFFEVCRAVTHHLSCPEGNLGVDFRK